MTISPKPHEYPKSRKHAYNSRKISISMRLGPLREQATHLWRQKRKTSFIQSLDIQGVLFKSFFLNLRAEICSFAEFLPFKFDNRPFLPCYDGQHDWSNIRKRLRIEQKDVRLQRGIIPVYEYYFLFDSYPVSRCISLNIYQEIYQGHTMKV